MEITRYIANRFHRTRRQPMLVGICGRAGSGKSTLVDKICRDPEFGSIPTLAYSGDWRFILDSPSRKEWLRQKWLAGMNAYLDAMNQFSWWDFEAIFRDLHAIQNHERIELDGAYDRATGLKTAKITLGPLERGIVLYENCILGSLADLNALDIIVVLNTPDRVCLERLLQKDSARRSVTEIASRFLMTTYSENIFLRALLERFADRTVGCNSDGTIGPYPDLGDVTHVPVPTQARSAQVNKRGTIFCDLDGTLIKHVPTPSSTGEDIELLEGSIEKLREFREKGYHVVLTTSRSQSNTFSILHRLRSSGIDCDQVICDLPLGPRHLINDSKGSEIRAIAHAIDRDGGLKNVHVP